MSVRPWGCSVWGWSFIHHVHHPDLQLWQLLPQDRHRRQRLQSGRVAAAGHDHVRLLPLVVGGPVPDTDALGAVLHRLVHGEPLGAGMLAGHHDVHIVPALDAVVEHAQQAVGVRGQIDAHHVRLLVCHVVQEAGVLVGEAVMVLLPHIGGARTAWSPSPDRPGPGAHPGPHSRTAPPGSGGR